MLPAASPSGFCALFAHLDDQTRRRALEAALKSKADLPDSTRSAIDSVLRRIPISGFRDGLHAPTSRIVRVLDELVTRVTPLARLFLSAWMHAHKGGLYATARKLLSESEAAVLVPEHLPPEMYGTWPGGALDRLVAACAEEARCSAAEAELMLCAVSGLGREGVPGTAGEESEIREARAENEIASLLPESFDPAMSELRKIGPDDSAWDNAEALHEAILDLTEEKLQVRSSPLRELTKRSDGIRARFATVLTYVGVELDITRMASSHAADALELLDKLEVRLLEYEGLIPRADSLAAERARRALREECESGILELLSRLAKRDQELTPAPGEAANPPVAGTSESTASTQPVTSTKPSEEVPVFTGSTADPDHVRQATSSPSVPLNGGDFPAASADDVAETLIEPKQQPVEELEGMLTPAPSVDLQAGEPLLAVEGALQCAAAGEPLAETIAEAATDPISQERVRALWCFLLAGDVSAAYWLARALDSPDQRSPVRPWLLACIQAGHWIQGPTDPLANDLLAIATDNEAPTGAVAELLGLCAAMRPALVAPATGMSTWLRIPAVCPELAALVTSISNFANYGQALTSEDLVGVRGLEQSERQVRNATDEMSSWLDAAPQRRTKLGRATEVWVHLLRQDLRPWMSLVAEDRRADVATVRRNLKIWRSRDHILRRVRQLDRMLVGLKVSPIVGDPLHQLVRFVEEGCLTAEEWAGRVDRLSLISDKGDWFFEQVETLRSSVQDALPLATRSLRRLRERDDDGVAAAAHCLEAALRDISESLMIVADTSLATYRSECGTAEALHRKLGTRLLLVPDVPLRDDGVPDESALGSVADSLVRIVGQPCDLDAAWGGWLQRRDLRFASYFEHLEQDPAKRAERRSDVQRLSDEWRSELRRSAETATQTIEQSVVDGIIGEERRATLAATIAEALNHDTPDFGARLKAVHGVQEELALAREERLLEQRQRWAEIEPQLAASRLEAVSREALRKQIGDTLNREDTRLADEFLAQLPQVLSGQTELPRAWFQDTESRSEFDEFIAALPAIEDAIKQRGFSAAVAGLKRGDPPAFLRLPKHFPRPRLEEAATAFDAWRDLRSSSAIDDVSSEVRAVLGYLGFNFLGGSVSIVNRGGYWLHARARMSAGDMSLVPQFGSQATEADGYDVICVWERPGMDRIGAMLGDLRVNTALMLYLARLAPPHRRDITRTSRRLGLNLLTIDESLMLFLAGERDQRLGPMMACTLPYSCVNPFTPFQAGNVPPEMFFGRQAMIRELLRPGGSCLVYGGRQLGKSALLRAVERKFHSSARGQLATVIDIKSVGSAAAGEDASAIWQRLRDRLVEKRLGVLAKAGSERPREIVRQISDWLDGAPDRRLLVMFDEADDFLDADAKAGFTAVTILRDLMTATNRRFKVVFTGLHNVQRFNGIPNQPLAHFGGIEVGPLEPDAAHELIARPFQHLGYRFDEPGSILRILSYTNYHPGLIQLFCQSLLQRMHQAADKEPPYTIRQSDVEAVYRDVKVQRSITERLDWTLALDRRYQAIAWSLVYDQTQSPNGYARAYSAAELLAIVRQTWPQGFEHLGPDDLRGLLDEMVGLGVLVRNLEGQYRLRSPNVVRLMGTEDDVFERLAQLSRQPAPIQFDADSHHASIDGDSRYSPLTHAQERRIAAPQFGVALIFASAALGWADMPSACARLIRDDTGDGAVHPISASVISGEQIVAWLRRHLEEQKGKHRLLVYQEVAVPDPLLDERIDAAVKFCKERSRTKERYLRIVFLFNAETTAYWLSLDRDRRQRLEQVCDAALAPAKWNAQGLRQWLDHKQKLGSDEVVKTLLAITGGWKPLLEVVFARGAGADDLRECAEQIAEELSELSTELHRGFRDALEIEQQPGVLAVLRALDTLSGVPEDLLTPDLVESRGVTAESIRVACELLLRLGCVERDAEGILHCEPVSARVLLS